VQGQPWQHQGENSTMLLIIAIFQMEKGCESGSGKGCGASLAVQNMAKYIKAANQSTQLKAQ